MSDLEKYIETRDIKYLHSWVEENYVMFKDLASKLKRRYNIKSLSIDDLFSECIIAFYATIDKYEPKISKPTTYIYFAVERAIINKLKFNHAHDFEARVPTLSLDEEIGSGVSSSPLTYAEIISDGTDESTSVMTNIMLDKLRSYMASYEDGLTKDVYNLYIQGMTMSDIGRTLGYTKQYISKILKNLEEEIRLDWHV